VSCLFPGWHSGPARHRTESGADDRRPVRLAAVVSVRALLYACRFGWRLGPERGGLRPCGPVLGRPGPSTPKRSAPCTRKDRLRNVFAGAPYGSSTRPTDATPRRNSSRARACSSSSPSGTAAGPVGRGRLSALAPQPLAQPRSPRDRPRHRVADHGLDADEHEALLRAGTLAARDDAGPARVSRGATGSGAPSGVEGSASTLLAAPVRP
jgi:hypothetical protein